MTDKKVDPGKELLSEEEREKILARAHAVFAWVGNMIPDKETFNGTKIELRNLVFKLRTKAGVTENDRMLAHILIGKIKDRKRDLENRLRHDELTKRAAMDLLDEISGLIKAINDLHDVEMENDLQTKKGELMNKVEDEKRWQIYLKDIRLVRP
ncbi:MAG: DUF5788 family protein [Thermoplasmata archaeon]|nr:DUF5788 family protein [Thermoplasmata archaeon]